MTLLMSACVMGALHSIGMRVRLPVSSMSVALPAGDCPSIGILRAYGALELFADPGQSPSKPSANPLNGVVVVTSRNTGPATAR